MHNRLQPGSGACNINILMIKPFEIRASEKTLSDLKSRIVHTRWPDAIRNSNWELGADIHYMKELANYWSSSFDWRKTENTLNGYPNFIADIDGYKIHFLHIKGRSKNSIPLVITHGWPYSVLEMLKIITPLTSRQEFSFDLVIPSMIGYGFSQKIIDPGCNTYFMADVWYKLMTELGYSRFGVQGGDFGAGVAAAIALKHPESVIGMHLNYIPGFYVPVLSEDEELSAVELEYLRSEDEWYLREGGYSHQQRTRPLTLSYGLNDSPVGLCAWIIEKMIGWAGSGQITDNVFEKDDLLSNVTLYWITETIHSSVRLYNENSKIKLKLGAENKIGVPTAISRFKYEEPFPPREYVERGFTIRRWTEFNVGGHFPAFEQPDLLSRDIIPFFKSIT